MYVNKFILNSYVKILITTLCMCTRYFWIVQIQEFACLVYLLIRIFQVTILWSNQNFIQIKLNRINWCVYMKPIQSDWTSIWFLTDYLGACKHTVSTKISKCNIQLFEICSTFRSSPQNRTISTSFRSQSQFCLRTVVLFKGISPLFAWNFPPTFTHNFDDSFNKLTF